MSENTEQQEEVMKTEEGVPFDPSATAFREAILDGKTVEEAEYIAKVVGEARADSVEGFLRWKVSLVWKKFMLWAGGIITAAGAAIAVYFSAKITSILSAMGIAL
jgi:hypothetical protein